MYHVLLLTPLPVGKYDVGQIVQNLLKWCVNT